MSGDADSRTEQDSGTVKQPQAGTQRSRFGGPPVQPIRAEDEDSEIEVVDQDPGERQKRNQGDIEEDKLAS